MPELFNKPINDGFISVWDLAEDEKFICGPLDQGLIHQLKTTFNIHRRFIEKAAAHFILQQYNEQLILNNLDRKPTVNHGFVSISHCQNKLALYYSRSEGVGIDLEIQAAKVLKIKHRFLNTQELEFCGNDPYKCLVIWAAKESIFKKYGNETSFFAENICVNPFKIDKNTFKLNALVTVLGNTLSQTLECTNLNNYVLVYTC